MTWRAEPLPRQPERDRARYDGHSYRECRWCGGRGCLMCEQEADAAYKRAFPNGPQPIATFDMTTPEGRERAKRAIGGEALQHAFGPEGRGIAEIIENAAKDGPA